MNLSPDVLKYGIVLNEHISSRNKIVDQNIKI